VLRKVRPYTYLWLPELVAITVLTLLTFILFTATDWDLEAARFFFHPDNLQNPWADEDLFIWKFFYRLVPILTIVIAVAALGALIYGSLAKGKSKLKLYSVFVILSVLLGPGLVVNAAFKDHWGRPRPRQVKEFNGRYEYKQFWQKGLSGKGKSFPCGHSSLVFSLFAFWFIWRRKKRFYAYLSLIGALTIGSLAGVGRMAAGGHFLSDVIFSAIMPFAVCWLLYYFVLKIPYKEDYPEEADNESVVIRRLKAASVVVLALAVIAGALLAHPIHKDLYLPITDRQLRGKALEAKVQIDECDIRINSLNTAGDAMMISGYVRGFGFPNHKVKVKATIQTTPELATANYNVLQTGFFTERNCEMTIRVAKSIVKALDIKFQKGELILLDPALKDIITVNK
jgi:lipid A 4'-phosphatase